VTVKTFLRDLANLRDDVDASKRFLARFMDFWPLPGAHTGQLIEEKMDRKPGAKPELEQLAEMLHQFWFMPLREGLRSIWTVPDLRAKQLGIVRLLDEMVFTEDRSGAYWGFPTLPAQFRKLASFPAPTVFEQCLLYLIRPGVHTSLCANQECSAPYFFQSRRGEKYCSTDCARPAQQEFKRRWWREHGRVWRKQRKSGRTSRKRK
jgi:hypothetical protein